MSAPLATNVRVGQRPRVIWLLLAGAGLLGLGVAEAPSAAAVTTNPGSAASLVVEAPATTTAGSAIVVTVTARSVTGSVATSYRGTVAFTSTDPRSPVLPAAYSFTAADAGVHTFAGVVLRGAGSRTLTAADSHWGSVRGVSKPISVAPGAATRFAVLTPGNATAGTRFSVTVTAKDPYYNVVVAYRGTVRLATSDHGVGAAVAPATYRFTAADAGTHVFAPPSGATLTTPGVQNVVVADAARAALRGTAAVTVRTSDPRGLAVFTWGKNASGQLGDGTTTDRSVPVRVGAGIPWAQVAAGPNTTAAIATDGTLWTWGENGFGQLGDGTTTRRSVPVQVGTDTRWASVALGFGHTVAVKSDGTLWAWGWNGNGQLGLGDASDTPVLTPTRVGSGTSWAHVTAGFYHTLALTSGGDLWAWGYNGVGQLGDGTLAERFAPVQVGTGTPWASVSTSASHTVAVTTGGALWAWGLNSYGELGSTGAPTDVPVPTPARVGVRTDWASASAGESFTVAVAAGTLWAWGDNESGQLGDGTRTTRFSPVRIGTDTRWTVVSAGNTHAAAITSDGALWAWGIGGTGELGDGTRSDRAAPARVGPDLGWASVSAGIAYTAATRS